VMYEIETRLMDRVSYNSVELVLVTINFLIVNFFRIND